MPFRQQFESSGLGPCQNMMQAYFGGLDQAAQGFEPMTKGLARVQLEMIGLASRRAQAYLEFPSRLAQARTPQDLFGEQMRFWQTAFQQYSDSSRRVVTAMAAMATPQAGAFGDTRTKARSRDYLSVPETGDAADARGPAARPFTPPRRVA